MSYHTENVASAQIQFSYWGFLLIDLVWRSFNSHRYKFQPISTPCGWNPNWWNCSWY